MKQILDYIYKYGKMIKFSHTIFAMPFALASVLIVSREYDFTFMKLLWIITAMIGARSAAMGFNRLIDKNIDAKNERTKDRELPTGEISVLNTIIFITIFSALFIFSAWMLNDLCYYLSYPTLLLVFFYSFSKRFTTYSHYILGLAIGIAPAGGWFAISGEFSLMPIFLTLTLLTYIAGFDILYSCQDEEFDRENLLHSIPEKYGRTKALKISRYTHMVTFLLLILSGLVYDLSTGYYYGVLIMGSLLFLEHYLVKNDDLSKLKFSFLYVNSAVSIMFFVSVLMGV
ncbi:MAG: UbiA family prenyltransferase [Candidatus Delongbacteria bacterium]|nr:UbiA family prenyltransferase [Candidatus Delongbacteria bacterium]MBN2834011.1 UbiA family prenyltransferase [Candidatus Delongbacteria bacterium]